MTQMADFCLAHKVQIEIEIKINTSEESKLRMFKPRPSRDRPSATLCNKGIGYMLASITIEMLLKCPTFTFFVFGLKSILIGMIRVASGGG